MNHLIRRNFLQQFNDLQQLFIVSQVEVKDKVNDGVSYQYGDIHIKHAEGEKCERCWNYTEELGSVGELEHLCPRCQRSSKNFGIIKVFTCERIFQENKF